MVQAVGCTLAQIAPPGFHVHRHMACQGPDAGVVLAAQEEPVAVGIEVAALDVEVAEVGMDGLLCGG